MEEVSLNKLSPGKKGEIVKIGGGGSIRRRILDMDAATGTIFEVEKIAPLKRSSIEVKLQGYPLSLRKDEAAEIYVKAI